MDLIGQGGIPSLIVGDNLRLEHVWVEAFVDFEPSRGINHTEGDNWIPMDASYKQYDYSEGMDIQNNIDFDAQPLIDTINNNATINEAEGWVQNIPQADIEEQLQELQTQIEDYINTQNPEATLGDVLGLQDIKIKPAAPLSAGLPYELITAKQSFSEIPNHLRHTFSFKLRTVNFLYGNTTELFQINKPTAELAGKKLALSYKPSTPDDEAVILSFIPEVAEGEELDPNQLPTRLPGHMINMTAQLTADGEILAEAGAGKMGSEVQTLSNLHSPTEPAKPSGEKCTDRRAIQRDWVRFTRYGCRATSTATTKFRRN